MVSKDIVDFGNICITYSGRSQLVLWSIVPRSWNFWKDCRKECSQAASCPYSFEIIFQQRWHTLFWWTLPHYFAPFCIGRAISKICGLGRYSDIFPLLYSPASTCPATQSKYHKIIYVLLFLQKEKEPAVNKAEKYVYLQLGVLFFNVIKFKTHFCSKKY